MAENGRENSKYEQVIVRNFQCGDTAVVQRIFREGMLEMIYDTAFRGLRHHVESQMLYALLMIICFLLSRSLVLTFTCVPAVVLAARYYYSSRVVYGDLQHALTTDMADIEQHYLKSADSCLWVAVLDGRVAGLVAARLQRGGAVELLRMSVDRRCRRRGLGVALGLKVLEFAKQRALSSTPCPAVVLHTVAYTPAPHQLYRSLGFRCVGVTMGHITPGVKGSLLERAFYRVRLHHYQLDLNSD